MLIGLLLQNTKIKERLNAVSFPGHPCPEILFGDVAQAMIGLLCLGQPGDCARRAGLHFGKGNTWCRDWRRVNLRFGAAPVQPPGEVKRG